MAQRTCPSSLDPKSFEAKSFEAKSFEAKSFDPRSFDPKSGLGTDYALIAAGIGGALIALIYLILI